MNVAFRSTRLEKFCWPQRPYRLFVTYAFPPRATR